MRRATGSTRWSATTPPPTWLPLQRRCRTRSGWRMLPSCTALCRNSNLSRSFRINGDEVTWATIGNASTAQGGFWEAINAIGVLHAPAVITVYDDGYGISVPNQFQMVKENIYSILKGFERIQCPAEECDRGYDLYSVNAWDYPALLAAYHEAGKRRAQISYPRPGACHRSHATAGAFHLGLS